ncbi:DUF6056 family protein [Modicisalibacter sp. R2A 31.J]|uniref:DUF6056 family protein n=1 Tax=Modicisalibacter sp. R2A 31.J TaxID=2831898 RepID=UPI001CCD89CB|nr:DUF6056 family protein [Modicisalibacter sp. R2A 31.J]
MRGYITPGRTIPWLAASFALVVYGVIFWMAPLQGEDFAFARRFAEGDFGARLAWMLQKWPDQFLHWNARLGEQMTILWLNVPPVAYLVAACLAFVGLHALVAALFPLRPGWRLRLALSAGLTFLLWPAFEVFFWKTANAGYLHPLLLNLLCVAAFTSAPRVRRVADRGGYCAGLCLAGLLAGFSFENVPLAVAAYMLVSWALLADRRHHWRALLPVVAMVVGWVALMLVPSTAYRRSVYRQIYSVGDTDLAYYLGRASEVSLTFLETAWPLLVASLVALALLVHWHRRSRVRQDPRVWWLILPAVLVVGSVSAAPYTEPRAFLLAWVLMLAIVVEAAYRLWCGGVLGRVLVAVLLVGSLGMALKTLSIYRDVAAQFDTREQRILDHLGTSECGSKPGLTIEPVTPGYPARYFNGRDAWTMQNMLVFESYYGCWLKLDGADG